MLEDPCLVKLFFHSSLFLATCLLTYKQVKMVERVRLGIAIMLTSYSEYCSNGNVYTSVMCNVSQRYVSKLGKLLLLYTFYMYMYTSIYTVSWSSM